MSASAPIKYHQNAAHADLPRRERAARASIVGVRGRSGCLLTRTHAAARRLARALREHVPVRHVLDGRFMASGPVQVAVIDDVRGLELDLVGILDADDASYALDDEARRALYVGVTRARRHLVVTCVGTPSPLLTR